MSETSTQSTLFAYRCPPGLLATVLCFWSWHAGIWPVGIAMAVLVELPRWLPFRFDFSDSQFVRLANISSILLLLAALVFFIYSLQQSIFLLIEWMPLILFLVFLTQLYSKRGLIPLKAIVASLRKQHQLASMYPQTIDLRLPYIILTLIAASMVAPRNLVFYLAVGSMLLWALWSIKPRRYSPLVWLSVAVVALGLGFSFQIGIQRLQGVVQEVSMQWFKDWSHQNVSRKSTAIGQIGELKLSNNIIMRIKSSERKSRLLRQASYNRYYGGSWHANDTDFRPVVKRNNEGSWLLDPGPGKYKNWLEVSAYLKKGEGFLALPAGAGVLNNRRSGDLLQNKYGTIQIMNAPSLLDFQVYFAQEKNSSQMPGSLDLELPEVYRQVTREVVQNLNLKQLQTAEAVKRLQQYFYSNFRYSLVQSGSDVWFRPLTHFLRSSRKGHCEYFATAGALILRAAGIPSRYVSGYLMSEYQESTQLYIVRSRHAHAWTQAYIEGRWVDLDFTPPTWAAMEQQAAPWWEASYDMLSHVVFLFLDWWWSKPRSFLDFTLLLLGLFATYLGLRNLSKLKHLFYRKVSMVKVRSRARVHVVESPFNSIITYLEHERAPRNSGETTQQWLARLFNMGEPDPIGQTGSTLNQRLQQLLQQHYEYRFHSSVPVQLGEFQKAVEVWLADYQTQMVKKQPM